MNQNSETLLKAFSQLYFYEDLHLEDLCYFPKENPRDDLPDLVVNLGNAIIMVKLEVRGENAQDTWVNDTARTNRMVMQEQLSRIQAGTLETLYNSKGEPISLGTHISAFPVLVLDNGDRQEKYPPLLEKYSPEALIVNCMLLEDFKQLCGTLIMPIEIMHFLYYRAAFYGELSTVTRSFRNKLEQEEQISQRQLIYQFLAEKYNYYQTNLKKFRLKEYQEFIRALPGQKFSPRGKSQLDVLRFLTHLSRSEAAALIERVEVLAEETRRGSGGLLSSLRPKDDQYAAFFAAKNSFPFSVLRQMVYGCGRVKNVMEIVCTRSRDGQVHMEYILTDDF